MSHCDPDRYLSGLGTGREFKLLEIKKHPRKGEEDRS